MSEQLKKIKFYPLWQEEKEMAWLHTMSRQGWHLKKRGYTTYWFEKGEKTEYIYNIDYMPQTDKGKEEYQALYQDTGWEYIDEYAGWQYYRILKGSKNVTIFTDVESKKRRLKKILVLLLSLAGANAAIILMNLFINFIGFDKTISAIPLILFVLWGISATVVILLIMTSIRLFFQLRKLSKSLEE